MRYAAADCTEVIFGTLPLCSLRRSSHISLCCSMKAALLESVDRAAVLSRFHPFPSENSIASAGGASILLQPQGRLVAEERQVIVGGNGCFIGE